MVKKGVKIGIVIFLVVIIIAVVTVVLVLLLANDGWTKFENTYFSSYADSTSGTSFDTLEAAKVACMDSAECNAITLEFSGEYTLRKGTVPNISSSVDPYHRNTAISMLSNMGVITVDEGQAMTDDALKILLASSGETSWSRNE